jgi:hypothetical protein
MFDLYFGEIAQEVMFFEPNHGTTSLMDDGGTLDHLVRFNYYYIIN